MSRKNNNGNNQTPGMRYSGLLNLSEGSSGRMKSLFPGPYFRLADLEKSLTFAAPK